MGFMCKSNENTTHLTVIRTMYTKYIIVQFQSIVEKQMKKTTKIHCKKIKQIQQNPCTNEQNQHCSEL